ncbi:uncharacterized protein LOC134697506 [Mytilus trossulus]|uniref:uncharacterized protein LOC134697506 n=1 Tax=Mytilus trossulus TaxID=6551 RepID=UPI003005F3C5
MRCKGRIHNAPLSESAKQPYILPANHRLSELIVLNSHELVMHSGVNATVTQIRQTFWIPSLRQFTRKLLHRCTTCKKVNGKPYRAPDPLPLQKIRLQEAPPFTVTGIDFTAALQVKENDGTLKKVYICLFTCASTKAVHLEIIPTMNEESFLLGFRRFTSRKSLPQIVMSDNALSFISASQEVKRLCESKKFEEALSSFGVEWRFIPKRAPWFGGWWERLIALTKTNLKKTLGCALINLDMLQTFVTEIEKILNDRPLTYDSTDIIDSEPLTPAHLLYGRRVTTLPYPRTEMDNINETYALNASDISKRAQRLSTLIEHFWNRWRFEYLTSLRKFHKKTGDNKINIKVGDVVQVHDDKPRIKWKTAVVEEVVTGNDGLVRSAIIRTNSGQTSRPIVKLYPLEINEDELSNTSEETK